MRLLKKDLCFQIMISCRKSHKEKNKDKNQDIESKFMGNINSYFYALKLVMSQKCHRRLKFRQNFSVLAQCFMNHFCFLLFQSIKECTKNSPLGREYFLIFLLGNSNKIILLSTTIYTYLCYSSHYFLNKGLMVITLNFFSNQLPLAYFKKYFFYIYQERAGKGRGGKNILE